MNPFARAMWQCLACTALGCSLLIGTASAQALAVPPDETPFAAAHTAYEINHWNEAHAAFAALADKGHAESARIALQMARHGRALYGRSFVVTPEQARRWLLLQNCRTDNERVRCGPVSPSF